MGRDLEHVGRIFWEFHVNSGTFVRKSGNSTGICGNFAAFWASHLLDVPDFALELCHRLLVVGASLEVNLEWEQE